MSFNLVIYFFNCSSTLTQLQAQVVKTEANAQHAKHAKHGEINLWLPFSSKVAAKKCQKFSFCQPWLLHPRYARAEKYVSNVEKVAIKHSKN